MRDYRINSNTLAIIPYGNKKSLVYENTTKLIIDRRPNFIINKNCIYHGSSIDGRLQGTLALTGYSYKAPILVREDGNIIFFPTASPRLKKCCWINLNNLKDYYEDEYTKTSFISFNSNTLIEILASFNIINNQVLRATRLDAQIRKIKAENI